jgi:hypothetical protein
MEKGLKLINAQRRKASQPEVADQEDHFHILHRGRRGLREVRAKAVRAFRRAEAEVRAALGGLTGPEWSRLKARLVGPKAFTFLSRVQERLAALPVAAALREAAVRLEGLRGQPEQLRGQAAPAGALRGVLLACGLVLSLSGQAGVQALAWVRGVLSGAWRASSLVEGLNSVLRRQQRRQKRMTQGLLDLKRLYWNQHVFVAGRRKGKTPYGKLGLVLPPGAWWQLIQRTPERLRDQLSELNPAA